MIRYALEDATLQLPPDHVVSFVVTVPTGPGAAFAPNLVVSRDRLRPNEDLKGYVDRQVLELAKRLKRFKLHGREDVDVGGLAGHRLACGWFGSQGPLEQHLTFVRRDFGVLTFTATAAKDQAEKVLPVFDEIVRTAELAAAHNV